jgi:ribose-phosphate pyrophosphokinase
MREPLIFATPDYQEMQRELCALTGWEAGAVEGREFPDGERYQRIEQDVDGREVVLLGGTTSDVETLRLYDLACGLVKYGAWALTLVIPFFGYSTMERAVKAGEVVTAKTRARLLSSIPSASESNRVVLMDLHVAGMQHYFEGTVRTVHLYAKPVILEVARQLGGDDFVLACTDAGRAKWVESLANDLRVTPAFVFKRRLSGEDTEVTAVSANVQDRRVVIYDDMIRTGSSLMGAAKAYLDAGASEVSALATHGVFPGDALGRLQRSGLFTAIACTDTHPNARALQGQGLQVYSVAPVVADLLTIGTRAI